MSESMTKLVTYEVLNQTGEEITKLATYQVLDQTGLDMSKTVTYLVLQPISRAANFFFAT